MKSTPKIITLIVDIIQEPLKIYISFFWYFFLLVYPAFGVFNVSTTKAYKASSKVIIGIHFCTYRILPCSKRQSKPIQDNVLQENADNKILKNVHQCYYLKQNGKLNTKQE